MFVTVRTRRSRARRAPPPDACGRGTLVSHARPRGRRRRRRSRRAPDRLAVAGESPAFGVTPRVAAGRRSRSRGRGRRGRPPDVVPYPAAPLVVAGELPVRRSRRMSRPASCSIMAVAWRAFRSDREHTALRRAIAVAAVVALSLAGCGSGDSASDADRPGRSLRPSRPPGCARRCCRRRGDRRGARPTAAYVGLAGAKRKRDRADLRRRPGADDARAAGPPSERAQRASDVLLVGHAIAQHRDLVRRGPPPLHPRTHTESHRPPQRAPRAASRRA